MGSHKAIKGIIFDFDGTIFDMILDWQSLNNTLKKEYGVNSLSEAAMLTAKARKRITKTIGEFEAKGVRQGVPMPSSLDVLSQLNDNYKLAITSRNNRATVESGLRKIGFREPVKIVAREDTTKPKPNPEALQKTLSMIGLQPEQVIMVGDTFHDLEAARRLGIICVIVRNDRLAFCPEGADFYIESLADLQAVIKSVERR